MWDVTVSKKLRDCMASNKSEHTHNFKVRNTLYATTEHLLHKSINLIEYQFKDTVEMYD